MIKKSLRCADPELKHRSEDTYHPRHFCFPLSRFIPDFLFADFLSAKNGRLGEQTGLVSEVFEFRAGRLFSQRQVKREGGRGGWPAIQTASKKQPKASSATASSARLLVWQVANTDMFASSGKKGKERIRSKIKARKSREKKERMPVAFGAALLSTRVACLSCFLFCLCVLSFWRRTA